MGESKAFWDSFCISNKYNVVGHLWWENAWDKDAKVNEFSIYDLKTIRKVKITPRKMITSSNNEGFIVFSTTAITYSDGRPEKREIDVCLWCFSGKASVASELLEMLYNSNDFQAGDIVEIHCDEGSVDFWKKLGFKKAEKVKLSKKDLRNVTQSEETEDSFTKLYVMRRKTKPLSNK